jgi:hypothetical protein
MNAMSGVRPGVILAAAIFFAPAARAQSVLTFACPPTADYSLKISDTSSISGTPTMWKGMTNSGPGPFKRTYLDPSNWMVCVYDYPAEEKKYKPQGFALKAAVPIGYGCSATATGFSCNKLGR